jgi:hypothetical protein
VNDSSGFVIPRGAFAGSSDFKSLLSNGAGDPVDYAVGGGGEEGGGQTWDSGATWDAGVSWS